MARGWRAVEIEQSCGPSFIRTKIVGRPWYGVKPTLRVLVA